MDWLRKGVKKEVTVKLGVTHRGVRTWEIDRSGVFVSIV